MLDPERLCDLLSREVRQPGGASEKAGDFPRDVHVHGRCRQQFWNSGAVGDLSALTHYILYPGQER